MPEINSKPPGFFGQLRKLALTGAAALQNRGELFLLELEEERVRLVELIIWTVIAGILGMMFLIVLTATIIFLFPAGGRIYAAAGFCGFYLLAALLALLNLRALWRSTSEVFSETIAEAKKDAECLESLK